MPPLSDSHPSPTYRAVQVVGVPEGVEPNLGNDSELLSAPHPRLGGPQRNKFHAPIVGQSHGGGLGQALREGEERSRVGL